jgi:hypothetical protein
MVLACLAGACVAAAGVVVWFYARGAEQALVRKAAALRQEAVLLEDKVMSLSAATYRARLQTVPDADLAGVFDRTLSIIPPEGRLAGLSLSRAADLRWDLSATVVFAKQAIEALPVDSFFSGALVRHMFVDDKPALRIGLRLPDGKKDQ